MNQTNQTDRLPLTLLLLRVSVFVAMLMWTIDKFVRPDHAARVLEEFYALGGFGQGVFYLLGVLELILLIGFLIGYKKWFTYGLVLVLHGLSTVVSYQQYFAPFEKVNLLFYAAWPMLAACFALYYLRARDTLLVVEK